MSQPALRNVLRWGHIVASLLLGTYLYSPLSADPTFAAITLYVAFPFMAVSGVWMWKQGAIARLFSGRSR